MELLLFFSFWTLVLETYYFLIRASNSPLLVYFCQSHQVAWTWLTAELTLATLIGNVQREAQIFSGFAALKNYGKQHNLYFWGFLIVDSG